MTRPPLVEYECGSRLMISLNSAQAYLRNLADLLDCPLGEVLRNYQFTDNMSERLSTVLNSTVFRGETLHEFMGGLAILEPRGRHDLLRARMKPLNIFLFLSPIYLDQESQLGGEELQELRNLVVDEAVKQGE